MVPTPSAIRNRLDMSACQKPCRIDLLTRPHTGGLSGWVNRSRKPVLRSILVQPRPIHTRLALRSHRTPIPRQTSTVRHRLECPPKQLDGPISQTSLIEDQGHVAPPSAFTRWLRYAPSDSRSKPNPRGPLSVEHTCCQAARLTMLVPRWPGGLQGWGRLVRAPPGQENPTTGLELPRNGFQRPFGGNSGSLGCEYACEPEI